jgi:hypothetical protein
MLIAVTAVFRIYASILVATKIREPMHWLTTTLASILFRASSPSKSIWFHINKVN